MEENQVFRNDGSGAFRPMPAWRVGSIASGRGMVMVDLDDDGDLDIVVNNLLAPAQLLENRLCHGGAALLVAVRWPNGNNTGAIGSRRCCTPEPVNCTVKSRPAPDTCRATLRQCTSGSRARPSRYGCGSIGPTARHPA